MSVRAIGAFAAVIIAVTASLPAAAAPVAPASAPADAAPAPVSEGQQPYDKFKEGAQEQPGLFTVWRKHGKVYLELAPGQLDATYLLVPILSSGVGRGFLFSGLDLEDQLISFHRTGDRIVTQVLNPFGKATPGTPGAQAVAETYAPSVWSSDAIVSTSPDGGVVFPADVFLTDTQNLTDGINPSPQHATNPGVRYHLDPRLSYFGPTKSFPKNSNIEADLTFTSASPGAFDAVPDPRSIFIRLHYSIVQMPDDGYVPRLADDRIGYFLTARRQYDNYGGHSSFVRYIDRWNIQKRDPNAAVSPAKQPIVYYISNDVPVEYRGVIREALLKWNDAFRRIGITDVVQVRQQPADDPTWDPEDIRFSVVRWITTPTPVFGAYGPHISNPLTGEIFRADIVIDANVARTVRERYDSTIDPTAGMTPADALTCRLHECDFGYQAHQQLELGALALDLDGVFSTGKMSKEQFIHDYMIGLVLHESGHNFGLRHNFRGHTSYTLSQLHDKRFTSRYGIANSVMEYAPINLSPHGVAQGDYFQTVLGPFDYWVIKYGYQPLGSSTPDGELPALRAIAAQNTDPMLAYGTDEDASFGGGFASDPRIQPFVLSNDGLGYVEQTFRVFRGLFGSLGGRIPRQGESYEEARTAFVALLNAWQRSSLIAAHYIGGEYFTRNHRGDPHAALPFRVVPRAEQRRAFQLLARNVFADDAFRFSPALLNSLGDSRYSHWQSEPNHAGRLDFPLEDDAAQMQGIVLRQMWQPTVLARLRDMESRQSRPGETMSLADLYDWTDEAVFGDLSRRDVHTVPAVHRALQRRYADMLVHLLLNPDAGVPGDARALARAHLVGLSHRIAGRLARGGLDEVSAANLADIRVNADRALAASTVAPVD